jgi:hypothetical protein
MSEAYAATFSPFAGIPFGPGHPPSPVEAKVLLHGLMLELRDKLASSPLAQSISREWIPRRMDSEWNDLWDCVTFRRPDGTDREIEEWAHLTLYLGESAMHFQLTLPNNAPKPQWLRLRHAGHSEWLTVLTSVLADIETMRTGDLARIPELLVELKQRHFHARREVFDDAMLSFKLETLSGDSKQGVKPVSAWLYALQAVLRASDDANFQFQVKAVFPYGMGQLCNSPDFATNLVTIAQAFAPLYALMSGETY